MCGERDRGSRREGAFGDLELLFEDFGSKEMTWKRPSISLRHKRERQWEANKRQSKTQRHDNSNRLGKIERHIFEGRSGKWIVHAVFGPYYSMFVCSRNFIHIETATELGAYQLQSKETRFICRYGSNLQKRFKKYESVSSFERKKHYTSEHNIITSSLIKDGSTFSYTHRSCFWVIVWLSILLLGWRQKEINNTKLEESV